MASEKLQLGQMYRTEWDERPYRVIGFDDTEIFYDCLWPHDNSWAFSGNFKKKCYFYRMPVPLFIAKATLIDFTPLTIEEQNFFRPDLPLRLCRTKEFHWNAFESDHYHSFKKDTTELSDKSFLNQKLMADKIVLIPLGNNGGLKKGTTVTADNLNYFECSELIWKAKEIQEAVNHQVSAGIGLYRIGFEKGLPSYYIGEFLDKTGI